MANRHSLGGPLQREVAISASVRQGDEKENAPAWDWVSAAAQRATWGDTEVELLPT